jgi:LytS/YehU family sensor histidine kinase
MSEKETVTLQEEIEALKLYLDIEQVRFNGELNYNITIGNNINTDFIKIPAMLIQPYVENALKHGLLHKKGTKHIDLNFSLINKTLKIEVNDNGIGRNKSQEINAQKIDKHKSFSTNANLKRIELLNANNFKISLNIKDKVNSDGASDGTDVTITCDI